MLASFKNLIVVVLAGFAGALLLTGDATGAETANQLEIHEMSLWVTEPTSSQMNAQAGYSSAMPGTVDSVRSRTVEPGRPEVQPLSIMFFSGKAPEVADLSLRIPAGRFLATWPPAENKNSRLAWNDLKFSTGGTSELFAFVPEGHWFERARKLELLQLQRGARTEKFIAYDPELNSPIPLRVDGGPEKYQIVNGSKYTLKDALLVFPGKEGARIGWLNELPSASAKPAADSTVATGKADAEKNAKAVVDVVARAAGALLRQAPMAAPAQPLRVNAPGVAVAQAASPAQDISTIKGPMVEVEVSAPLNAAELNRQGADELKTRLAAAGLNSSEINLLLSLYTKAIFESKEPVLLFRLPQQAVEELLPLEVDPENTKIVRVALVLCLKVDPRIRDEVKTLIDQLSVEDFAEREKAEQRLYTLGRLAIPALKEATKSKDPEQVMRAERLLLQQKEKLDGSR